MYVSVYDNAFDVDGARTEVSMVFNAIMTVPQIKDMVSALRAMPKEQYDKEKRNLPAATFSGVFPKGKRQKAAIQEYTNTIVIDIDKLDEKIVEGVKAAICSDPHTMFCFISPSGKGVKCLFRVNTGVNEHLHAFLHLEHYFKEKYGLSIDESGKDVSRLCFLSYDEKAYWNPQSSIFIVDKKYGDIAAPKVEYNNETSDEATILNICVKWVEKKCSFVEGERNVFVHALACALNRVGVKMDNAYNLIASKFVGLSESEMRTTIRSAFFHNQHEHGAYKLRDIGGSEFVAPPYVANYTDDVAGNDIMRITALLWHHKIPIQEIANVVGKVARYYDSQGYIDMRRASLTDMMNRAVAVMNENMASAAAAKKLEYSLAEDIALQIINNDIGSGSIATHIPLFDSGLRGGLQPGNFYGLIGVGGTFKSIIAQYWSFMAACNDNPVLYLNGEMSTFQFYERMVMMAFKISLYHEVAQKRLTKENVNQFIENMKSITKNNLFFVSGSGFNEENIIATCEHIYSTTGKEIKLIVVDGVTQMDNKGKDEIPAAIMNTASCKEIAKKANREKGTCVIGLMHISGDQASAKIRRDNGPFCRGGGKTIANMDGYFSTSLLIEENSSQAGMDELAFIPGKVYLRCVDKRSPAGVMNVILNIENTSLRIIPEDTDPSNYEVKLERRR